MYSPDGGVQHIGDGLERMPLCKHPGGKTVAEDMRALACYLDARDPDVAVDPVRQHTAVLESMVWRAQCHKEVGILAIRAGVLQIVEQTLTYLPGQRQ